MEHLPTLRRCCDHLDYITQVLSFVHSTILACGTSYSASVADHHTPSLITNEELHNIINSVKIHPKPDKPRRKSLSTRRPISKPKPKPKANLNPNSNSNLNPNPNPNSYPNSRLTQVRALQTRNSASLSFIRSLEASCQESMPLIRLEQAGLQIFNSLVEIKNAVINMKSETKSEILFKIKLLKLIKSKNQELIDFSDFVSKINNNLVNNFGLFNYNCINLFTVK
ncbi:hypothetical protein P9112_009601 [Eukaryota sp. TZLM1-RC]